MSRYLNIMPSVQFTSNLKRFYPQLNPVEVDAKTVSDLLSNIDLKFPGISKYLLDDQHRLRHHVNIFINENMVKDRSTLSDQIQASDKIYIMQALSGG